MAKQAINVGTVADDGTGDALRTAFQKANANDSELYAFLGGSPLTLAGVLVGTGTTPIASVAHAAGWLHNDGAGLFAYSTPTYVQVGADAAGAAAAVTPTTLGLVIGTNVQAYNTNLTAINQALTTTSNPTFGTVSASLTGHASLDLPLIGGTLTGNLLFTDATYDIGASGATRPRNLFLSGTVTVAGTSLLGAVDANSTSNSLANIVTVTNGSSGTGAGTALQMITSAASNSQLMKIGTGYTPAYGMLSPGRFGLYSSDAAGIFLMSDNGSGSINLGIGNGSTTPQLTVSSTGTTITGTIKTADPGLGAGAWKLGQVESGLGLALNTASYVQVMVDGAAVKLAQVL